MFNVEIGVFSRLFFLLIGTVLIACSRPTPVTIEPERTSARTVRSSTPSHDEFDLWALSLQKIQSRLGNVKRSQATPGTYLMSSSYSLREFVTMEHVVTDNRRMYARIEIKDNGTVHGCVAQRVFTSSSRSHYATRSGKHEHSESDLRRLVGFRGTWAYTHRVLEIEGKESAWELCPLPEAVPEAAPGVLDRRIYPAPFKLRCYEVQTDRTPLPLLVCEGDRKTYPADAHLLAPATELEPSLLVLRKEPGVHIEQVPSGHTRMPSMHLPKLEFNAPSKPFVREEWLTKKPAK